MARDRLGIKPLYLDDTAARLRFASSTPALLAGGGTDTSIDPIALHYYMTFHCIVPAPRTILNGVRKLPPATVRVDRDRRARRPSTSTGPRPSAADAEHASWSDRDWEEALLESLRVAVDRRMVADVPVGVLLSGGIDSSLVVALLAEAGQRDLKTFSIGFASSGGEKGDEFEYSSLVAKRFGTDHHRIVIDDSRLLPGVDAAIAAMSEPMVSHDCVAFYLLSEDVAKSVKVVQSGQGADEVLGGYDWYPPLADVAREDAAEAYASVFFDRRWSAMSGLVSPEWLIDHDAPSEFVASRFAEPVGATALDAALRSDTTVMLVDDPVKRVDNMTMAWGLEARVPFLDHELVELAGRIPPGSSSPDGGKGDPSSGPPASRSGTAGRGDRPDEGLLPGAGHPAAAGPHARQGARRASPTPRPGGAGSSRTRPCSPCWPTRTAPAPSSARTRCGSSACWRCGCSTTGSDDQRRARPRHGRRDPGAGVAAPTLALARRRRTPG